MPFFSIIIPCYNCEKYLENTFNCILDQNFSDFEVILVDDGSSDNSILIAQSFLDKFDLKIIQQQNSGAGSARNKGILASTGKYIAFLDADDFWFNNKLDEIYKFINQNNSDLVCHYEKMMFEDTSIGVLKHGPYKTFYDILFKGNCLSPSAVCVKRDLLIEVGLFSIEKEIDGCEDWDLWLKLAKKNINISYIPKVLGLYMLYNYNVNTSQKQGYYRKGQYVFEKHVKSIDNITPQINNMIKGSRAIQELYVIKDSYRFNNWNTFPKSLIFVIKMGILNTFFWKQIFAKFYSSLFRKLNLK